MYTANTMSSTFEALGMSLLYSSDMANPDQEKVDSAAESARVLVEAVRKGGLKPRDIVTRQSIENAVALIMATGGSTNAVLHYLAIADAAEVAELLGLLYDTVPIAPGVEGIGASLEPLFAGREPDVTEENIQSRVRGTILMAVSNKFGAMVVTTGNKSEVSVGYSTLYGDMNGGFNPIKDLYKTEVYRLSRWRNAHRPVDALGPDGVVIPERIITKAPTAELRENQTDQDSLPPYADLDAILAGLVEEDLGVAEIVARGFDVEVVRRIERLLYLAEYKRRQAAPGVKISRRNFGRDRRYPITNKFRDRS
jgi:NAD+ synthase